MINTKLFITILATILFLSCQENSLQPADFVGTYSVKPNLETEKNEINNIKDQIKKGLSDLKSDLRQSKNDLNEEFDLNNIDTTNLSGKMEYLAKSLSNSMQEVGSTLEENNPNFSEIFGEIAESGLKLKDQFFQNLSFDIELQSDGDIKLKNFFMAQMILADSRWEIHGKEFRILSENNKSQIFKIENKTRDGFKLKNEELELDFSRK